MPPGQIRKEAAKAGTLSAGVWLVGLPPFQGSENLSTRLLQQLPSLSNPTPLSYSSAARVHVPLQPQPSSTAETLDTPDDRPQGTPPHVAALCSWPASV